MISATFDMSEEERLAWERLEPGRDIAELDRRIVELYRSTSMSRMEIANELGISKGRLSCRMQTMKRRGEIELNRSRKGARV